MRPPTPDRAPSGEHGLAGWLAEAAASGSDRIDADTLVAQTLAIVGDADHVSLTVRHGAGYRSLACSSGLASDADALQYELREGPCLEAAEEGDWYVSADVGRDARWPSWGPQAARLGVGSLLSARLVSDGRPFGAINMYADRLGRFADRDDVDAALVWANLAAYTLAAAREVEGLETALASRHTIGMAQGILMERFGLDETGSFLLLRRLSSHSNEKLRDLAAKLVATRALPDVPS